MVDATPGASSEMSDEPNIHILYWSYPRIGVGTEPMDKVRIDLQHTRAVNDIILSYDGMTDCWVISGSFCDGHGDFEIKPIATIKNDDLDEERFHKN